MNKAKTIFILLTTLTASVITKAQTYEILSLTKLNRITEEKQQLIDTTYINDDNAVFVTIFKDGTAILSPPVLGGTEGILFYDIKAMHTMIASRKYPVKGTGTFWESDRERIENINTSIPYYCNKLSELLNFNIELSDDPVYLKELSTVIGNQMKKKKQPKYLKHYLSIYIGELIRKYVNGEWKLAIQYAFNIYYTPDIIKENKHFDLWLIFSELDMAKFRPINIEEFIKEAKNHFYPYNSERYVSVK